MKQAEAIALIHPAITSDGPQTWADLGCGSGTFTTALASLLPAGSIIHALDMQAQRLPKKVGDVQINFHKANFEKDNLSFKDLDGVLLANSLHYVAEPLPLIERLSIMLDRRRGKFILIEYDRRLANQWVPYPVWYVNAIKLFSNVGFNKIIKTGEQASRYGQATIYAISASR